MTGFCKVAPPLAAQKTLLLLASRRILLHFSGFAGVAADSNLKLHDGSPRRPAGATNSCGARHSRPSAVTCRPLRPPRLASSAERQRFGESGSPGMGRTVAAAST